MDVFKITSPLKFILILILFSMLQGCMNAAVTSAQVVYGRHNLKKTLDDSVISMKAEREIYIKRKKFKDTNVAITTFNNVVLLVGQVKNIQQRNEIEHIIRKIDGVEQIHNLVTIAKPTTALVRMSDTWITTKIKTKLIAMNDIDPSQIKVVTENGTVYLMGIVPPDQADIAIELARTTEGVQSVVKVFSYLRISKT